MVERSERSLNLVFRALADSTRRGMLSRLASGGCSISELAAPCRMSFAAVSKHVGVLERAHLVRRSRDGRVHNMELRAESLRAAGQWVERYRVFWKKSFDALEQRLEQRTKEKP